MNNPFSRKKSSSAARPTKNAPPTPAPPIIEHFEQKPANIHPREKDPRAPIPSSSVTPLSVASPSCDPRDLALDEGGSSKESRWRTAYGAARIAVDVANASSDLFLPLKAVVGALSVLIKNYDQTVTNADQVRDIEERVRSLGEVLASPVGDQDKEEMARREALRKKLTDIVAKLKPLSEHHGLVKFLKNVDHAAALNGFIQDLANAITDYQTSIQQSIYRNTKKIDEHIENIVSAVDLELLEKLNPVHNAGYQAGHHDACLRGTRESILDEIMRWAKDPQDRQVFWLNGLAGTGKSTIAQTFSGKIAETGILGASFFCSRDYLDRKELKKIFPTIAYQLACRYPAFRSQIIQVIRRDPSIAQNSLISQFKDLIVNPLSSTDISCVIVVDALDECVDNQPASAILSVLGRLVNHLSSIKFFITGRPEPRIRTGFRLPLLEPITEVFLLHEVESSTINEDIRLYLQERLTAVAKQRSHFDLSNPWPSDEDLTILTKKSSGLFIFASTLTRFIGSEHHEPTERLRLLLTPTDSTVHEGRAGIDLLYTQLLTHAFSDVKETDVFANMRRVLGAVILASNPLSRTQISGILGMELSLVTTTLRHLHSVLLVPTEDSKEIRVFHKSFPDFLQDPSRCSNPNFHIRSDYHDDMALGCLKLLKSLKPNSCDLPKFVMNRDVANLPELLEDKVGSASRYACAHWSTHVRSSRIAEYHATRLIAFMTDLFKKNAIPWIEVMSLENRLESVIDGIYDLLNWLGTVRASDSTSKLRGLAEDYLRFTMHFFRPIQQSALHIYHSALPLSPRSSVFFPSIRYQDTLVTSFDGRPYAWGAVVRTIRRNPGSFTYNTTFGHRIAAACDNSMVVVYDSVTGMLELSLSPAEPVHAMGGSPDGSVLFCRHQGPSVTLWDIQTGGLIHTFVLRSAVVDIAISLKGRYLAYRLSDGSVKFSEIAYKTEGAAIRSGSQVANFCWMEPEEQLAVAEGMSVQIWDVASGEVLKSFTMGYPVFGMVHSQESNQLVVVTRSGDDSAAKTISPLGGTSSAWYWTKRKLSHFTFSHATNELVCGAEVPTLELFDVSTLRWRCFKHMAITGFVSPLPSGFVAASGVGPDIQMLSLDKKYTSQMATQETLSAPRVHPDEGKTIAVLRPGLSVILAEPTTTSVLLTVPSNELPRSPIFAGILYLTLEDRTEFLQFWMIDREHLEFCDEASKGAMGVKGSPLDISPLEISRASLGIQLVTFHDAGHETRLCVRNAQNGQSQAEKSFKKSHLAQLLRLKFELKAFGKNSLIHFDHPHTPDVSCHRQQPLVVESPDGLYHVEDNMEWVVRGSKRVLWIPPGYVRSSQPSYCWTESTLIMYGQDGTLRILRFCS